MEQLYLATDTIHGICHKTCKVVNTIKGYLVYFYSLCFPYIGFTKNIMEIKTHKSGNPEIIGFLVPTLLNETILWSLFTTHKIKMPVRIEYSNHLIQFSLLFM